MEEWIVLNVADTFQSERVEQNMDLRTIILPQRTLGTVEREPSIKE